MEKVIEKISNYDILNNLIPGAVLCMLLDAMGIRLIVPDDFIGKFVLYYFTGIIASRIGSLVIEPLFLRFKLIKYSDKADFIFTEQKDKAIVKLLETNNMYRTYTSVVLLVFIMNIYSVIQDRCQIIAQMKWYILIAVLLIIFSLSYIKQTSHITKRVEITIKDNMGDKNEN